MTDLVTVTVRNLYGNGTDGLKPEAIPADGSTFNWNGGNTIQLMERHPVEIAPKDTPPLKLKDDRITYRRSLKTPSRFVYQP